MARRLPRGAGVRGGAAAGHPAVRTARRAWPVLLEAYRRWDRLTPEQQARYRRMASDYAQRGRRTLKKRPPRKG